MAQEPQRQCKSQANERQTAEWSHSHSAIDYKKYEFEKGKLREMDQLLVPRWEKIGECQSGARVTDQSLCDGIEVLDTRWHLQGSTSERRNAKLLEAVYLCERSSLLESRQRVQKILEWRLHLRVAANLLSDSTIEHADG